MGSTHLNTYWQFEANCCQSNFCKGNLHATFQNEIEIGSNLCSVDNFSELTFGGCRARIKMLSHIYFYKF